jgi:signal transduction histidine kinase
MQHAGGQEVRRSVVVRGGEHGTAVRVVVTDDGRGFDADEVPAERLGLRVSIRERVAKVGGRATVVSAPGEGTTVTIVWPGGEHGSVVEHEQEAAG